jgi:transposase
MSVPRRKYTKEEKLEIVKLSMEDHISIESLAKRYAVHMNSIYKWRSEYTKFDSAAFPGNGNPILTDHEKEVLALKKQLREVELEKEILKKALGIFSVADRKNLDL